MSKRKIAIFILTHGYPLWVILHLVLGNSSLMSRLLFNVIPLFFFGGLFLIWQMSVTPLDKWEKRFITYLVMMLLAICGYYDICVISQAGWVYTHNTQMAGFLLITLLFYLYTYYNERYDL